MKLLAASPRSLEGIDHPKASSFARCRALLASAGLNPSAAEYLAFFVPGRIEVLGKHTDYCGGRSLSCATDRGFAVVARPRPDAVVQISSVEGPTCSFALADDLAPPVGEWTNYAMTVGRRLVRNFGPGLRGADVAFSSDLPQAAGLSSSSALVVSLVLVLASVNRLITNPRFTDEIDGVEGLAQYCGSIENGSDFGSLAGDAGVGTSGGSQDHTAILCSRRGVLGQFGYSPVRHERDVAWPEALSLLVIDSGVVAAKTGAAMGRYNAVSRRAAALVQLWNRRTGEPRGTLASVVRSDTAAAETLRRLLADEPEHALPFPRQQLRDRLDQFVEESERIVPAAATALAEGRLGAFATLVRRSVHHAITRLDNQVRESIEAVEWALGQGAVAASPFGAGFGGSVWAMADEAATQRMLEQRPGRLIAVRPSAGAVVVAEETSR